MKVLVADDEQVTSHLLQSYLKQWNFEVIAVKNGQEALEVIQNQADVQLAILDWMMPEMDGLEACKRIREQVTGRSIYLILLTSRNLKQELVQAFAQGIDDYMSKPFNKEELKARLNVGERSIRLSNRLQEQILKEKQTVEEMRLQLITAARVQESLLPPESLQFGPLSVTRYYQPCDEIGGDTVNFFALDDHTVVCYIADISGHGVGSALLSVALLNQLALGPTQRAWSAGDKKHLLSRPREVLNQLSRHYSGFLEQTYQFFTILYAVIDLKNNLLTFAKAGHPAPFLIREGQVLELLSNNQSPIGLFEIEYQEHCIPLQAGDRLMFFTDGLTEASNADDQQFGGAELGKTLGLPLAPHANYIEKLVESVRKWNGRGVVHDDLSLLEIHVQA